MADSDLCSRESTIVSVTLSFSLDTHRTASMDHLILAAANADLDTCWIGAFDLEAAREVLGLPTEAEPIAFTPLGYPAGQPGPKRRKPLPDLVRYEHW